MVFETRRCADQATAEADCARMISEALVSALDNGQGRVSFMVSGGSTPKRLLPLLFEKPIDWERVDVFASDERVVPVDHPDSTEGMVREIFAAAGKPLAYHGFGEDLDPEKAHAVWRERVEALTWPVAVAFIGIGTDAHYASLFPDRPESADSDLFTASVPESPPHKHPRLTLGRGAFARVDLVTLVAAGEGKVSALEAARAEGADPEKLPAASIGEYGRAVCFVA